MILKKKPRRILAGALIVLGAVLLVLAPESPGGVVVLVAGLALELIGIMLERNS